MGTFKSTTTSWPNFDVFSAPRSAIIFVYFGELSHLDGRMEPRLLILAVAVALVTTAYSRAGLGWTVEESIAHYDDGKNKFGLAKTDELGREVYVFLGAGNYEFFITAWYTDGKMSKIRYDCSLDISNAS